MFINNTKPFWAHYHFSIQQNFNNTDDISSLRIVRLLWLILQTTTGQLFGLSRAERLHAHTIFLFLPFASWARSSHRIIWKSSGAVRRILILHSSPAALLVKRILSPEMDYVSINNCSGQYNEILRLLLLTITPLLILLLSSMPPAVCLPLMPCDYIMKDCKWTLKGACYLLPPQTNWFFPTECSCFASNCFVQEVLTY